MTATAVIALFVFFVCIAARGRPMGERHCRRTARNGRRAAHVAGRRSRG
jgi:hypothetical protein